MSKELDEIKALLAGLAEAQSKIVERIDQMESSSEEEAPAPAPKKKRGRRRKKQQDPAGST